MCCIFWFPLDLLSVFFVCLVLAVYNTKFLSEVSRINQGFPKFHKIAQLVYHNIHISINLIHAPPSTDWETYKSEAILNFALKPGFPKIWNSIIIILHRLGANSFCLCNENQCLFQIKEIQIIFSWGFHSLCRTGSINICNKLVNLYSIQICHITSILPPNHLLSLEKCNLRENCEIMLIRKS